jgi:hypothetical protein
MSAVTLDDIRRAVTANAFAAGRDYDAGGRVSDLRVLAEGHVIEAAVQGSARRPYRVRVALGRRVSDGGAIVSGSCSCPMSYNCKHVAATLFAAIRRESAPPPTASIPNRQVQSATAAEPPLSSAVAAWLHDLERAGQDETEEYPPGVRKRLLYLLDTSPASEGTACLDVKLVGIETRHGELAVRTAKQYDRFQFLGSQPARFLRPSDRAIIRLLASVGHNLAIGGPTSGAVLRDIIATGRGRWGRVDGPTLRLGEARPGRLAWRVESDGAQRPILQADNDAIALFAGEAWYVEPATGLMGPLELGLSSGLVQAVLASPPVPPEAAERLGAELIRRLPDLPLPPPHRQAPARHLAGPLVPYLELVGTAAPEIIPLPVRGSATVRSPCRPSRAGLS